MVAGKHRHFWLRGVSRAMSFEQEVLLASFLLMGFASSGCVILIPTQADVDHREARCCFVLAKCGARAVGSRCSMPRSNRRHVGCV